LAEKENLGNSDVPQQEAMKKGHFDVNYRPSANSEQICTAHGSRVTKCVDSDSGVKIKIKVINFDLTLSPPSEISRTEVYQLALPYWSINSI
jgi:hypothetical protein